MITTRKVIPKIGTFRKFHIYFNSKIEGSFAHQIETRVKRNVISRGILSEVKERLKRNLFVFMRILKKLTLKH